MLILNMVIGGLIALFVAWSVGHIAALRSQIKEARASGEVAAAKLHESEIGREAIEKHCNELRNIVAQLSARPPIAMFTDQQIQELVKAILAAANPTKTFIN